MTTGPAPRAAGTRAPPPGDPKDRARRFGAWLGLAACLGALAGLGAFTFGYGDGASYLSNDPNACTNSHVMQSNFDSWVKSSHHAVATCNDCHLPHGPAGKWVTKADNGFFHSLAFTTGEFHEPIQIKPRNARVTQNACLHCHGDFVNHMRPVHAGGDMLRCVRCHADAGHAGKRVRLGDPPREAP